MNNKLYKVVEGNLYCDEGVVGYIEEEYEDETVMFLPLDSDIEVYISLDSLELIE